MGQAVTSDRSKKWNIRCHTCKAVNKWQAFDRNFSNEEEHVLLYDDGRHAQFMPRGHKNFFSLLDYKNELGKDFKRITLYLCTLSDHMVAEGLIDPSSEAGDNAEDEMPETSKTKQLDLEPNWFDFEPVQSETVDRNPVDRCDESFAQSPKVDLTSGGPSKQGDLEIEDVFSMLKPKVEAESHFFLVCCRSAPLARHLRLWQRQAHITPVTATVRVKYSGEDGIDQGAIAKEFFR